MRTVLRPLLLLGLLGLVLPVWAEQGRDEATGPAKGEVLRTQPVTGSPLSPNLAVAPHVPLQVSPTSTSTTAAAEPSDLDRGPAYRAVIVGISDYLYINDLSYCDDDALDIYYALEMNGWNPANMELLIDGNARKSYISQALATMKEQAGPNDVCLFTFSGHGSYDIDDDGDEYDLYDEFLCPYDTTGSASTMIRDDELASWLSGFETEHLCVILDSCFSGGMTYPRGTLGFGAIPRGIPKPSVASWNPDGMAHDLMRRAQLPKDIDESIFGVEVMMASREDQVSWEDPYLRNGVFSYFVIDCIQSWRADTNHDGAMSGEEIFDCAGPQAEAYIRRNFGEFMFPQFYDNHPGPLILVGVPACPTPTCDIGYLPEYPGEGDEVCFDAHAYAECDVADVEWDFGDGGQASGESVCHTYTAPATYTVICTVTDGEGNEGACWAQVRIRPAGCVCNVGLVACGCSMSSGRVGQPRPARGQIMARNWDSEACLVMLAVIDNVGNAVFASDPIWIEGGSRVRIRFEHEFTEDEVGRNLWSWTVWPVGCEELTPWDNERQRIVNVLPRVYYCEGVLVLCAQYLGSDADVTVEVVLSATYTETFEHVYPGDILCVDAASAGISKLPPLTPFQVYGSDDTLIREDVIVTSCAQPIYVGQPFGAFQVVYVSLGTSPPPPPPPPP